MESLNKIAQVNANYSINGSTFQIPTATIMDWLSYKDGKTTIDEEKVRNYVADLGTNTTQAPMLLRSKARNKARYPYQLGH